MWSPMKYHFFHMLTCVTVGLTLVLFNMEAVEKKIELFYPIVSSLRASATTILKEKSLEKNN